MRAPNNWSRNRLALAAGQHQDAIETESGGRGGRLAAVVGLDRPGCDQGARPLLLRFGQQEFQLAGLIAAEGQPGLVVALDQQAGSAQGGFQAGHRFDRGG
jgi:hypothetical protein